jgi:hypothetical protein
MHSYNTKICVQMFWPSAQTPYPNNANFKPKLKKEKPTVYIFHAQTNTKKRTEIRKITTEKYYRYIVSPQTHLVVPHTIAATEVVVPHQTPVANEDSFAYSLDSH